MKLIKHYFKNLSSRQLEQYEQLLPIYEDWNTKINVISRKDMDDFYERHVLHSLAIAKYLHFLPESSVLDVGTGGGFPGIPLAIMFPEVNFYLVDSIAKKIKVVNDVVNQLTIKNVTARQIRAEKVEGEFDFIVSRAVTKAERFVPWVDQKLKKESRHDKRNGFLFLKGGELHKEFAPLNRPYEIQSLEQYFSEPFFETKQLVYLEK